MINKKHLKIIAFILILVISIGFAYLTSNLFINGLIGYRGNSWNIYFDNIQMINNDVDADKPIINNSKDAISFSLSFSEPGEIYKFSVDIINSGTLDAMLNEIIKNGIDSSNQDYISYTIKYYDDSDLRINDAIKAGAKTRIIIEVIYKYETSVVAPAGEQEFSFILKYIHANDEANYLSPMYEAEANNVFTINNVKSNSMSNFRIYGNTTQTQYEGYQLIKKDGLSTPLDDSDFWQNKGGSHGTISPLEDGWLRVVGDNTEGTVTTYLNFFLKKDAVSLEPDTYYTALIEFKNHSGEGNIVLTQTTLWDVEPFDSGTDDGGIRRDQLANNSSGSKKILLHTKNDLTGTYGLRGWVGLIAGESISIDIRITLVKGDYKTDDIPLVWEPYVGEEPSPNPDYPQEIKSVFGDSNLLVTGKNTFKGVFNARTFGYEMPTNLSNKITVNSSDNNNISFTITDDNYVYIITDVFNLNKNTTYTISYNRTNTKTIGCRFYIYFVTDNNDYSNFTRYNSEEGYISHTFTTTDSGKIAFAWGGNNTFSGESMDISNIQLEVGNESSDYEQYKEQSYNINLSNFELNKIGGYSDYIYNEYGNWYIEKKIGKYSFTDLESFVFESPIPRIYTDFINIISTPGIYPSNSSSIPLIISDKYVTRTIKEIYFNNYDDRKNGFTLSHNNVISFRRSKWTTKDEAVVDTMGTNFYFVYQSPVKYKISDATLISQLDAICNSNLFEGVNNIYYNSNISTDISFDYIEE